MFHLLWHTGIRDSSPLIVSEVKGIASIPKEKDALKVINYMAKRMKESGRTDVRGLTIYNHQRHLPALDRKETPFTDDVIETALQQDVTLITTWTIYKLVRNFEEFAWTHEQVKALFYQDGYIEAVPTHYKYVGVPVCHNR